MRDLLLDPDCRDGKHDSCVGEPCECDCHRPVWGESTAATPAAERRRRALRALGYPEKGSESHGDGRTPQTQGASEAQDAKEAQGGSDGRLA